MSDGERSISDHFTDGDSGVENADYVNELMDSGDLEAVNLVLDVFMIELIKPTNEMVAKDGKQANLRIILIQQRCQHFYVCFISVFKSINQDINSLFVIDETGRNMFRSMMS